MFEIIFILVSLFTFNSSAKAQEITVQTLPPQGSMTSEELVSSVERALEEAGAAQSEPEEEGVFFVIEAKPEEETIEETEPQFELSALTFTPIPDDYFNHAKFNALRNVRQYDANSEREYKINGTSHRILVTIENDPEAFTGISGLRFFSDSEKMAPQVVFPGEGRSRVFPDIETSVERRRNVVFSVYYENIKEISSVKYPASGAIQDVYQADLLLFSHSNYQGAFFTRLKIELDWSDLAQEKKGVVQIISEPKHIPLSETDFEVYVDLSQHKTVLKDRSDHDITLVFGVTTGGYDNRSSADGVVGSLSLQMPPRLFSQSQRNNNPEEEIQNFDIETSFLVKTSLFSNDRWNTNARVYPKYFNARPFRAIIDSRFVERDEEGKITNYADGYRLVGFHDEIESDGLIRAGYSNGCIRTTDPDLYTLDAIIDFGPKDHVPVSVKMTQPEFDTLESIIPRQKKLYRQVKLQSRRNSSNTASKVFCKRNIESNITEYTVKYYRDFNGEEFQTMVAGTCLTSMQKIESSPDNIVNYIIDKEENGRSSLTPPTSTIVSSDTFHSPIAVRRAVLVENYDLISRLRPNLVSITDKDNYISDHSEDAQKDKIRLVEQLQNPSSIPEEEIIPSLPQLPIITITGSKYPNLSDVHTLWRNNLELINTAELTERDKETLNANVPWYEAKCKGRRVNFPTSAHENCRGVLNALNLSAGRINATLLSN